MIIVHCEIGNFFHSCVLSVSSLEEYNENDSNVESEFEDRNIELEEWLAEWMKKEIGQAARELF